MGRKTYHYQDPAIYTRLLQYPAWCCVAFIATTTLCLSFFLLVAYTKDYISYEPVGRFLAHSKTQATITALAPWIYHVYQLCHLVVVFFVLLWTYRVSANMHALIPKPKEPHYASPGLAVAYYFVPIANIFCPCLVMQEQWEKNLALTNDERKENSGIIQLWWIAYIAFIVLKVCNDLYFKRHGMVGDTAIKVLLLGIASLIAYLISALLLIHITRTISQAQQTYAAARPAPSETTETP